MTTTTEMKIGMTFPEQIAVFDLETTSPDPLEARIVTAFVGIMDTASGEIVERWSWLVDPGVEIPTGASDIHGITTERARAEGMDAKAATFEISQRLEIIARRSIAIVIMNAVYDITVLDRETERHWPGMRPLVDGAWEFDGKPWDGPDAEPWAVPGVRFRAFTPPVIFDPMVFDRAIDKYRAGSRKLVDLAVHYGVPVETNAHDAEADCRMAGRVAIKLLGHARLADLSLSEVHDKLVPTKRAQAADLAHFWRTKKMRNLKTPAEREELLASIQNVEEVGGFWPLIPREKGTK